MQSGFQGFQVSIQMRCRAAGGPGGPGGSLGTYLHSTVVLITVLTVREYYCNNDLDHILSGRSASKQASQSMLSVRSGFGTSLLPAAAAQAAAAAAAAGPSRASRPMSRSSTILCSGQTADAGHYGSLQNMNMKYYVNMYAPRFLLIAPSLPHSS